MADISISRVDVFRAVWKLHAMMYRPGYFMRLNNPRNWTKRSKDRTLFDQLLHSDTLLASKNNRPNIEPDLRSTRLVAKSGLGMQWAMGYPHSFVTPWGEWECFEDRVGIPVTRPTPWPTQPERLFRRYVTYDKRKADQRILGTLTFYELRSVGSICLPEYDYCGAHDLTFKQIQELRVEWIVLCRKLRSRFPHVAVYKEAGWRVPKNHPDWNYVEEQLRET